MIDFSTITKAIERMFSESPTMVHYNVERSALENEDPGRCPWVGIYRKRIGYAPRRMGVGARNWSNDIKVDIILQAATQQETAEEVLEEQIKIVLDVLESDRTLRSTVLHILGYEVEYFIRENASEDIYFQRAVITITAEAKS